VRHDGQRDLLLLLPLGCACAQGFTRAFIVTSKDNRPSGQGYVTFDSNEAQLAAYKVRSKGQAA
jgi:hypothetical protein